MKDFVPYKKMSKRNRRKIDNQKRGNWGDFNPTSRVVPNKRKKLRERALSCE